MFYKIVSAFLFIIFFTITFNAHASSWWCCGNSQTVVEKANPKLKVIKRKSLESVAIPQQPSINANQHEQEYQLGKFIDATFIPSVRSVIIKYAQEPGSSQEVVPASPNSPLKTLIKSYARNQCVVWRGDTIQVWQIADHQAKLLHVKGAQIPRYDKSSLTTLCDGRIAIGLDSTAYSKYYLKYWHPKTQKFSSTLHSGTMPLLVPFKRPDLLLQGDDRYHALFWHTQPEYAASFPNGRVICANEKAIVIHAPQGAGWVKQNIIHAPHVSIGGIAIVDDANFITWQTLFAQHSQRQPCALDLWNPQGGKTFYARSPICSAIATQNRCFALCESKKVVEFDLRDGDQSALAECETEKEVHSMAHLSPGQLVLAHPDGSLSVYSQSSNVLQNALSRYNTQVKKQAMLEQIKKESATIQALALRKAQAIGALQSKSLRYKKKA